jgi:hypothetical protein
MARPGLFRIAKISASLLLCSTLIYCGKKGAADGTEDEPLPPPSPVKVTTFTLIYKTRVMGDGFSTLVAKIKVLDAEGQPVPRYVMRLISPIEAGVNYTKCEDSDSQGIVVCEIRAHREGIKSLNIAGSDQNFEVEFLRHFDGRGVKFDAVATGHAKISAGSDTVSASAGTKYSVPRQESGTDLMINDVSVSN